MCVSVCARSCCVSESSNVNSPAQQLRAQLLHNMPIKDSVDLALGHQLVKVSLRHLSWP